MDLEPEKKKELTFYEKEIARCISEGKGWTEAISTIYGVTDEKARLIYRNDFEDTPGSFELMSFEVNKKLKGPSRTYVYLPKPPIPDIEDENAPYKAQYQVFWSEHPLQAGKSLEICPHFSGKKGLIKSTVYKPQKINESEGLNKFYEVKEETNPLNQFFIHEEKQVYGQEPGNKTETQEDVTNNYLIRQLKELYELALEEKKYKEAKDCLELLGRIGGQIGEKVKKESVVTSKTVAEASDELMHASKVLGLDLPRNVTNIFEAQKKYK